MPQKTRKSVKAMDYNYSQNKAMQRYRKIADQANANRKIYLIFGSPSYDFLRNGLLRRGWIEKSNGRYWQLQNMSLSDLISKADQGNDYEKVVLSRMVENYPPYFVWLLETHDITQFRSYFNPYLNRIKIGNDFDFGTKLGFIGCAETMQWYSESGRSELKFPRFYRLNVDERGKFLNDFRLTECFSLLSFLADKSSDQLGSLHSIEGTVPSDIITFAIDRVSEQIRKSDHKDIDEDIFERSDEQWKHFLTNSRLIIENRGKFKLDEQVLNEYLVRVRDTLQNAKPHWPTLDIDGYKNIWIAKPGASLQGKGIVLMRSYEEIIYHAERYPEARYMVQKYIERPFLIHKAKFGIRQFFLTTLLDKVHIWMYKDCYLLFSSQMFTNDSLSNIVHLTNYAIQEHCQNDVRCPNLPECHMWSLATFKEYLKNVGYRNVWPSIYEGMKKCVIALVQASLVDTEIYQNSFEIYGADFMLDDKLEPYMLEVNSSPGMQCFTEVNRGIFPHIFEDLLKVVVDLPRNSNADTGNFERIFSVSLTKRVQSSFIPELSINGTEARVYYEVPETEVPEKNFTKGLKGKIGRMFLKKEISQKGPEEAVVSQAVPTVENF